MEFFFSSYFTSWILVPSFLFHVRFYFYLHDGHFIICHYLHLKIKIHKINCQFCDQNKCLYTLNELNFYRYFSFSFFLKCVKCGVSVTLNCHHPLFSCMEVQFFIAANIRMLLASHLGYLIGRKVFTNRKVVASFFFW